MLKSIRVKDRLNFLMFVTISIKRTILHIFASNVFEKRNPKVINLLVIYNMLNVSGTAAPLLVNVKIYDNIVTMEADSGAAISVMSVANFIKLNISDYTTRETYDTVRSVTGTQKVHSIVIVPVTVHSKRNRLDASCPNLYGRDWIQATNVSIDHIMREINKLTTVDVIHSDHDNGMHTHSDHGNEMYTHYDHGNDMHTHSEHGNEMQPIVNMWNDILCDENGSGSDIDSTYDVVGNNVLDLNTPERLTLCIMLIPV